MTPETLSTLQRAFDRLDALLPDVRNVMPSENGVSLSYGKHVSYRGEGETEWESIFFSWEEWLDTNGDYLSLDYLANERWQNVRREREQAERVAKEAQEERARLAREADAKLAPARKEAAERAKLAELVAKYGVPS